jgi:hypothetical protein
LFALVVQAPIESPWRRCARHTRGAIRIVTCRTAPVRRFRAWWQILILRGGAGVVVVVVSVGVVVVVVATVVVVVVWSAPSGPIPATALAVSPPATTSAANPAPVKSFCFSLIPTPLGRLSLLGVAVPRPIQTRDGVHVSVT